MFDFVIMFCVSVFALLFVFDGDCVCFSVGVGFITLFVLVGVFWWMVWVACVRATFGQRELWVRFGLVVCGVFWWCFRLCILSLCGLLCFVSLSDN